MFFKAQRGFRKQCVDLFDFLRLIILLGLMYKTDIMADTLYLCPHRSSVINS